MIRFIFEAKLKPGCTEQQYVEAWQRGSVVIQQQPGALGTRLHRKTDEPGTFLAIASWRSRADRDAAMAILSNDPSAVTVTSEDDQYADFTVVGYFEEQWTVEPAINRVSILH